MAEGNEPRGTMTSRVMAMPADTNASGDIFGGWVMSQMDIGGAVLAIRRNGGRRVATVAVDSMHFVCPVEVGDIFACYCHIAREGTTSIAVKIEAWVERQGQTDLKKVTQAVFTYVALDEEGNPTPLPEEAVS
ncbi:MAG: acyl-CoA thioesterase [Pseudomonadota bacterium]